MEETLVRALVIGAMFAALGFATVMAWKLVRSTSEGARRTRLVLGAVLALLLAVVFIQGDSTERTVVIALAFIVGAGYWIAKGMKND